MLNYLLEVILHCYPSQAIQPALTPSCYPYPVILLHPALVIRHYCPFPAMLNYLLEVILHCCPCQVIQPALTPSCYPYPEERLALFIPGKAAGKPEPYYCPYQVMLNYLPAAILHRYPFQATQPALTPSCYPYPVILLRLAPVIRHHYPYPAMLILFAGGNPPPLSIPGNPEAGARRHPCYPTR